jgi:ribose 5-phosphate isomerase B
MKIAIGSDHAGFNLKEALVRHLKQSGYTVEDVGAYNAEPSDYPVYGEKVAKAVADRQADRGIVICGNGIGMSIVANKIPGVRAALAYNEKVAKDTRGHNNSNVLSLAGRELSLDTNIKIADAWLGAEFSHAERHERRVAEIDRLEQDLSKH